MDLAETPLNGLFILNYFLSSYIFVGLSNICYSNLKIIHEGIER
jgi:hypothetical protein